MKAKLACLQPIAIALSRQHSTNKSCHSTRNEPCTSSLVVLCVNVAPWPLVVAYEQSNDGSPTRCAGTFTSSVDGARDMRAGSTGHEAAIKYTSPLATGNGKTIRHNWRLRKLLGFIGGQIVLHLLLRGENPKNICIVDIHRPTRWDLLTEQASQVRFVIADVCDLDSVCAAFKAEWPAEVNMDRDITVIHSTAGLHYYERHASFIGRSAMLNVEGTRNVLAAAQEAGIDIFIFTSSGTIPLKQTNFWVLPWQKCPESLVQVLNDSTLAPQKHEEFFSNYLYTKLLAENLVREADTPSKGFRMGCLQPGSAVIGWGGDLLAEEYLKRGVNPSWVRPMIQSMTYVENVSYVHLLYEAQLLKAQKAPPDAPIQRLGGDTFMITDTGDPISFSDLYLALSSLTDGRTEFPPLPASPMFLLAHAIEFYYKLQSRLPWFLPPIKGEVVNVQPALFDLAMVHIKIDNSRARLPPEEGGLGYRAPWTTLDGVCQLIWDHLESERLKQEACEKKS